MSSRQALISLIELLLKLNGLLMMRHLSLGLKLLQNTDGEDDQAINKLFAFLTSAAKTQQGKRQLRSEATKKQQLRLKTYHEKKSCTKVPF